MEDNVIELFKRVSVQDALRAIADGIDAGEFDGSECTLILGYDVFHIGTDKDDQAAANAVFDMQYGIHKLMAATLESDE